MMQEPHKYLVSPPNSTKSLPPRMSRIIGAPLQWLESKEAEYRELIDNKDFSKLWPLIFEAWFAEYPEHQALFPSIPDDTPLTLEQQGALAEAISKRQKVDNLFCCASECVLKLWIFKSCEVGLDGVKIQPEPCAPPTNNDLI